MKNRPWPHFQFDPAEIVHDAVLMIGTRVDAIVYCENLEIFLPLPYQPLEQKCFQQIH